MAQPGTLPGGTVLDGPPPSPAMAQGMSPGLPLQDLLRGPGASPVPPDAIPPEMLTGIQQAGEQMITMIQSFAQALPGLSQDWAIVLAALQAALSKVQQAGSGPVSPIAAGPSFPGGGFDRAGLPPLASGGI